MSPRPRTVTDEDIIAAAATVIGRLGPGKLTLAGVGKEIGLSASKKQLEGYRRLVQEAIDAGELVECDTQRLVRAITSVCGGSLISWAVFRQGSAAAWVRADVETVLEPYRLRSPRTSRARQSMRRSLRRARR